MMVGSTYAAVRHAQAFGLLVALCASGCGDAGESSAGATAGPGGGAVSSGSGSQPQQVWASVVLETEVGEAPGLMELHNESSLIITLQLGAASFVQLSPVDRAPPILVTSSQIADDMRLGYHETKLASAPCVFLNDVKIIGDTGIVPGQLAQFQVSGDDVRSLQTQVTHVPPHSAYLGLRVRYGSFPLGVRSIEVEAESDALVFPSSFAGLTEYQLLKRASTSIGMVRLVASETWSGQLDAEVAGVSGATIVVGQRRDDAIAEVQLVAE